MLRIRDVDVMRQEVLICECLENKPLVSCTFNPRLLLVADGRDDTELCLRRNVPGQPISVQRGMVMRGGRDRCKLWKLDRAAKAIMFDFELVVSGL
jgi:hypothetical protein